MTTLTTTKIIFILRSVLNDYSSSSLALRGGPGASTQRLQGPVASWIRSRLERLARALDAAQKTFQIHRLRLARLQSGKKTQDGLSGMQHLRQVSCFPESPFFIGIQQGKNFKV